MIERSKNKACGVLYVEGNWIPGYPVRILSQGPKRAHVQLMRKAKLPRRGWLAKGTSVYVPSWAVAGPGYP